MRVVQWPQQGPYSAVMKRRGSMRSGPNACTATCTSIDAKYPVASRPDHASKPPDAPLALPTLTSSAVTAIQPHNEKIHLDALDLLNRTIGVLRLDANSSNRARTGPWPGATRPSTSVPGGELKRMNDSRQSRHPAQPVLQLAPTTVDMNRAAVEAVNDLGWHFRSPIRRASISLASKILLLRIPPRLYAINLRPARNKPNAALENTLAFQNRRSASSSQRH